MDGSAFDRLSRTLVTSGTRRWLLGLVSGLPLVGLLGGSDSAEARPGRKGHRHHARHQHRHARTQRRKDQRDGALGEACIPTGQRCPSKKARGKHGKKLSCARCCQGASHTEADGKQYCGCQPNGGSCSPDAAASCCSGYCDGATCRVPTSASCERTCSTTCCNAQCCPEPNAICHLTTGACCVSDDPAVTCTGHCGEVVNNCGQLVTCTPCTCDPACDFCQLCNETSDTCEPDDAKDGIGCGACQVCAGGQCLPCPGGQVCCSGSCFTGDCCDSSTCSGSTPICVSHTCTACSGGTPCPGGQVCCGGSCFAGDCCAVGDCAASGNACVSHQCQCGAGGACGGDTPTCCGTPGTCTNTLTDPNNCGVCGATSCSGATPVCWNGVCVCGDVCPSGCPFASVQAAIDGLAAGSTIRICAGTYNEELSIFHDVSLLGAGEGVDGTVLAGDQGFSKVYVSQAATVSIDKMRITGASHSAVYVPNGTLTMTHCTITQNSDACCGGGVYTPGGSIILTNCTVSENTVPNGGGGIYNPEGSVTLNDTIITGNHGGTGAGGIDNGGTVVFTGTSVVCGNDPDQCTGSGYTNPNCPATCPP